MRVRHVFTTGMLAPVVPLEMGDPKPDQLQGTARERLCELCCRVCYDSLGSGRSSDLLHQHILDVEHLSVYEHASVTVQWDGYTPEHVSVLQALINRPGVYVYHDPINYCMLRVTANLRAILEWGKHGNHFQLPEVYDMLLHAASKSAPRVFNFNYVSAHKPPRQGSLFDTDTVMRMQPHVVDDADDQRNPHEVFTSMYVEGSRGWSHEEVRHRESAYSQRSTRYCDEAESPWEEHPVLVGRLDQKTEKYLSSAQREARKAYMNVVEDVQASLVGVVDDKLTARKQARGAARGYLGNALQTAMIVTRSAHQWEYYFRKRGTVHADAEIREVACRCLDEIKRTTAAKFFIHLSTAASPDGIGRVIV